MQSNSKQSHAGILWSSVSRGQMMARTQASIQFIEIEIRLFASQTASMVCCYQRFHAAPWMLSLVTLRWQHISRGSSPWWHEQRLETDPQGPPLQRSRLHLKPLITRKLKCTTPFLGLDEAIEAVMKFSKEKKHFEFRISIRV